MKLGSRSNPRLAVAASLVLIGLLVAAAVAWGGRQGPAVPQQSGSQTPSSALSPLPAGQAAGEMVGESATRTSEGGQVTIQVSWDGRAATFGSRQSLISFRVAMDTHAVDLDTIDLSRLAVLRTDRGDTLRPASWNAPAGGHHRKGALTFDAPAGLLEGARRIELVVRNVSGIAERQFVWELKR